MSKKPFSILIAPDKFKGSLGANKVAFALAKGVSSMCPDTHITIQPMADGGDGSICLLHEQWGLKKYERVVHDPLFRPMKAWYYGNRDTAFIEMATASGLALLQETERNCLKTTSLGTGELIHDAVCQGYKRIYLFIGGSATNDAAMGIASALGYSFWDSKGEKLSPIGENLSKIAAIQGSNLAESVRKVDMQIICDVNNPLYGPQGAAHVYAAQKGADGEAIAQLDEGLRNIDRAFQKSAGGSVQNLPGAGAAGGVGGGMAALFDAQLTAGISLFMELFDLDQKVHEADLVITGEGRLDEQSFQGKVVGGLLGLCQKHGKPLVVVCGQHKLKEGWKQKPFFQIFSLLDYASSSEEAIAQAATYLQQVGKELGQQLNNH